MRFKQFLALESKKEYTDEEEWVEAVKKAHPEVASKLKFKGRVEGGKDTISAEVSGQDRSYGVFDNDTGKGIVLEEPGKVHRVAPGTVDAISTGRATPSKMGREPEKFEKRGAPTDPARAFDKKNANRSVLKKLNDKAGVYYVIQGDADWHDWSDDANDELMKSQNYLMIHVMGGNTEGAFDKGDYYGINVILPLKDTKFELDPNEEADFSTGDPIADKQVKGFELAIVKAAIDALKKDDVPGIYDGLGGVRSKVAKVGGIKEWEAKQLSKLKNKKSVTEAKKPVEKPTPDYQKRYDDNAEWRADAKKFGYSIEGWGQTGGSHAHDEEGRIVGTWLSRFETTNDQAIGWFRTPKK